MPPSPAAERLHVVVYDATEADRTYLPDRLVDLDVAFQPEPLTAASAAAAVAAQVVSVFIQSRVDAATLDQLPALRLVATRSTGFDHVDLDACRTRGVAVANVPFYGENTVAEHTFALILTLSRRVRESQQRVAAGNFSAAGLTGFDLKGKTLGVVGAGSIGLHVIRIGRGFGMEVVAYDTRPQHLLAEVLGFHYVPLDDLLVQSDVITLHVPAIPATHHLIDRARLAQAKRGSLLINTARGSVVDTEALFWALDQGILDGAGLDVLEGEAYLTEDLQLLEAAQQPETLRSLVYGHTLLRRPNVIFTPHMAFNSREALQRIQDTTIENVRGFLAGEPRNLVT